MKFGFVIPGGRATEIVAMASELEKAGWDGAFYYDDIYTDGKTELSAAWPIVTAMAMTTKRIVVGSLLTAVGRRRPWELARESVTVDWLSNGRLVIPTGLGAVDDGAYTKAGMPAERRVRAEMLDESLEILDGLWSGRQFHYAGKYNQIKAMKFIPGPLQRPRIPIWVVGAWGRPKSMRRALKYDGLIPVIKKKDGSHEEIKPEDIRDMCAYVDANRRVKGRMRAGFDIVKDGTTPANNREAREIVEPFAEAGATWWVESMWGYKDLREVRHRIRAGPPMKSQARSV